MRATSTDSSAMADFHPKSAIFHVLRLCPIAAVSMALGRNAGKMAELLMKSAKQDQGTPARWPEGSGISSK